MTLPTRWAICEGDWGEKKKHLYCPDSASLTFYPTESEAREAAGIEIQSGTKMVLVMEIKTVLVARPVPFDAIDAARF